MWEIHEKQIGKEIRLEKDLYDVVRESCLVNQNRVGRCQKEANQTAEVLYLILALGGHGMREPGTRSGGVAAKRRRSEQNKQVKLKFVDGEEARVWTASMVGNRDLRTRTQHTI